jgi:hypothetical protein
MCVSADVRAHAMHMHMHMHTSVHGQCGIRAMVLLYRVGMWVRVRMCCPSNRLETASELLPSPTLSPTDAVPRAPTCGCGCV